MQIAHVRTVGDSREAVLDRDPGGASARRDAELPVDRAKVLAHRAGGDVGPAALEPPLARGRYPEADRSVHAGAGEAAAAVRHPARILPDCCFAGRIETRWRWRRTTTHKKLIARACRNGTVRCA